MKRTAIALIITAAAALMAAGAALAQRSPLHPTFPLLDADGVNVLESGAPISTTATCGTCHDTAFIAANTQHGDGGRVSSGALPPEQLMSTEVEMNCFLCHLTAPNNEARIAALEAGQAEWANTATLVGSGIVDLTEGGFVYNSEAFSADGALKPEYVLLQDPRSDNCGVCHGQVHLENQTPLMLAAADSRAWRTFITGQVISPQRIANSGANIDQRGALSRPWDVHAERVLNCVDCHFSVNNPIYTQPNAPPAHLTFDPRRIDFGEYLKRPSHMFASGSDSMRTCSACHDAAASHTWLPYLERHVSVLACESCHVPQLYAPALASRDATVARLDGSPVETFRGVDGDGTQVDPVATLITGYQPALLQQVDAGGASSLSPYNLVAVWYWAAGDPPMPVSMSDVSAVYLDGDGYAAEVMALFDADGDGALSDAELTLDSDAKIALIADRLRARGFVDPHIVGEVVPYPIHHGVVGGSWAVRDCQACHSENSRLVAALPLGGRMPGEMMPLLADDSRVRWNGSLIRDDDGRLLFAPQTQSDAANLYIFGRDSVPLVDRLGVALVLLTSLGVTLHAGLRVIVGRRKAARCAPAVRREYMYSVYERQWHWLQTALIFGLTFSGLVVHKPEMFSLFSFAWMVDVHNLFALLLVINAALALFYHLASGEIRQFIPRPYGFFDQMMAQAVYYLRGIFRGEPHPFEKQRERKLNPIQQLTYFGLLNVLLPLQVISGVLMWGAQQFPALTQMLGGLPFLAPFHTLIAWLLVMFIIVHVYMTTTGHEPAANLRAMIFGYDEVETPAESPTELKPTPESQG